MQGGTPHTLSKLFKAKQALNTDNTIIQGHQHCAINVVGIQMACSKSKVIHARIVTHGYMVKRTTPLVFIKTHTGVIERSTAKNISTCGTRQTKHASALTPDGIPTTLARTLAYKLGIHEALS
eukprot:6491676-Amphidinium_carterae.3